MIFHIITLFPQSFESVLKSSIIGRAISKKLIKLRFVNPRDFATDKHKTVDDKPYGGGKGMIMRVDILEKALSSIPKNSHSILLSASGKKYNQNMAKKLSKKAEITLICGHYEGIDARLEKFVDEVISVGDYILTGGELAAMVIIDTVSRFVPDVIDKDSATNESFRQNLLEHPQYTRPEDFKGQKVPKVLLSGNHGKIESYSKQESQKRTKKFRPDLLD